MGELPVAWAYVLLLPLGIGIATYGRPIGAGGGILIVPTRLFLHPHESANIIAGISFAVIFLDAISGTPAYGRWSPRSGEPSRRTTMFRRVLLAAALQNWEVPNPYARAAREVAIQLAKGSANPLYVLTLYHYQAPVIEKNPFIGSQVLQEINQLMRTEEDAIRTAVEAKLRQYVQEIEDAGVAVVPLVRPGDPRAEVIRVAEEIHADLLVIGSHSKRRLFDIGSTAQAICKRSPVTVVLAAPAQ
jgi:nucleotide-binding universal stress UspA family protein